METKVRATRLDQTLRHRTPTTCHFSTARWKNERNNILWFWYYRFYHTSLMSTAPKKGELNDNQGTEVKGKSLMGIELQFYKIHF